MLRQVQRLIKPVQVRSLVAVQPHEVLKLGKTATLKEITFAYMALAKVHHPDYGGDPEDFRLVNQAYRAMKKKFAQGLEIADAKTSPYSVDADFHILGREEPEWEAKTNKILNLFREHLVLSRGSGQAGSLRVKD